MKLIKEQIKKNKNIKNIKNNVSTGFNNSLKGQSRPILFLFILFFIISLIFVISITVSFFLTLDRLEEVKTPNLHQKSLLEAMAILQEYGLNVTVQSRYSDKNSEKGLVISQEPLAGTMIKVGGKVILRVSKGAIFERVSSYAGWNIEELKATLANMKHIYGDVLQLGQVIWVDDSAPYGQIIAQQPPAGSEIDNSTLLEVVVSRGDGDRSKTVENYIGLSFQQALKSLESSDTPFEFILDTDSSGVDGTVTGQAPTTEQTLAAGEILKLTISKPKIISDSYVFGILKYNIPRLSVSTELRIEADSPQGMRHNIFNSQTTINKTITVPYLERNGTRITIYLAEEEVFAYTVQSDSMETETET